MLTIYGIFEKTKYIHAKQAKMKYQKNITINMLCALSLPLATSVFSLEKCQKWDVKLLVALLAVFFIWGQVQNFIHD